MKYNKKEIMNKAWEFFKRANSPLFKTCVAYTFSDALKAAWREAKKAAEKAKKIEEAMEKKIVSLFGGQCFVNTVTGVIGGWGTYKNRSALKNAGFKWQYFGGVAYEYNKDGFAWVGGENSVRSILEYAI